jgi:hypothetical protein
LTGALSWIKSAIPASQYYPGGFTVDTTVSGSRYERPARGNRVLNVSNVCWVVLSGGELTQAITNYVTLGADNRVTSTNKLSLTFNLANGLFSGKLPNSNSPKPISFGGVVLQKATQSYGCFLGKSQCGEVYIGP